MKKRITLLAVIVICICGPAFAQDQFTSWPPRDYLIKGLVNGVEKTLATFDPATGQFGSKPWICNDQNELWPLAVAWSLKDDNNPYYHDEDLLKAIARGGECLTEAQDENGAWVFRKKDNTTWGQVHQPWTYSRWIRAYTLVKDALTPESKAIWNEGLLRGFTAIRKGSSGSVGNMAGHNQMALYIAGIVFENEDWKQAAAGYLHRLIEEQERGGYWSEHFGPVIGYNMVYVEILGIYYSYSYDSFALEPLKRSAKFHADVLLPDGSSTPSVDERQLYSSGVNTGNVGFAWTPEGRGFLIAQMNRYVGDNPDRLASSDYAATMLMNGASGDAIMPAAQADNSTTTLQTTSAIIKRVKPWQWTLSGFACAPPNRRWVQDRGNLIDIYHDELGLVIGGGNTKLQPLWSTFTLGDTSLLKHTPGDENPDFTPDIDLKWTPDMASLNVEGDVTRMALKYGGLDAQTGHGPYRIRIAPDDNDGIAIDLIGSPTQQAEAHLPLMYRSNRLQLADGETIRLTAEEITLSSEQVGDHFIYDELRVSMPVGAYLKWPIYPHNQYAKDGHSWIPSAKLVLCMPFNNVSHYAVGLSYAPEPPFDGLIYEARDMEFEYSEGQYTKRLDNLGAQFLGRTEVGSWIRFKLPGDIPPGKYELFAEFVLANEYGIVNVLYDGQQVGKPFDAYCVDVDSEGERVSFGEIQIIEGDHTVAAEIAGKNEASKSQTIGVKRWLLRRIDTQ